MVKLQVKHCLTRPYIECLVINLLVQKKYAWMDSLFRRALIFESKARPIEQVGFCIRTSRGRARSLDRARGVASCVSSFSGDSAVRGGGYDGPGDEPFDLTYFLILKSIMYGTKRHLNFVCECPQPGFEMERCPESRERERDKAGDAGVT